MRTDVAIIGGGHNALVAAALLARAGRNVVLLEAREELGGAAVSERAWPGVDARVSRYSYLVSLFPRALARELGIELPVARRSISSYTPVGDGGILVGHDAPAPVEPDAWTEFYGRTGALARALFPTVMEPLRSAAEVRSLVGDAAWEDFVERPIGEVIESSFADEALRGVVLTDALIGTFASAHDPSLVQNRCFLYHVIGNGTGDWDVPIGGMGAVSGALAGAAADAGADLRTGVRVETLDADDGGAVLRTSEGTVDARHVVAGCAPEVLDGLIGRASSGPRPEGAQLKVNMLLARLPRLRDASVDPRDAFAGTFHVREGYAELEAAHATAAAGDVPELLPCETYCHSLSDPSILGDELVASGAQTMTLFGLHAPARIFERPGAREEATRAALRALDSVLAEPIEDCLLRGPDGEPCLEVRTPQDLEAELGLPRGHIFHRDLDWPWAEDEADVGRWGVETDVPSVVLGGAGARRGGGVSGIAGHNAARALLER